MRNLSVIKGLYQGNGVTRRWAIPFEYNDKTQIFVTITTYDEGDYTYRVLDRTEYTIDEDSVEIVYPKTDDDAPIPSTQYLTVWRDTDLLQLMDLTNQGAAWPDSIEASLDKLHQIVQELAEGLSRSLKVDIGDPQTPDEKLVAIQDYVLAAAESSRSASASEASAQRAAEAAATSEANAAESERLASGYADTATAAAGRAEDSAISARAYNAPDYDNAKTYQAGDVVTYIDGNSYKALQETTGHEPPNIIYWQKVTDYVGDDFFEVDEYGYIVPMDSPSHSRYWRVDQDGYIVPIEGGDGGYRPDTRQVSAEYLNVTNEGYVKHLRADDISAQEVDVDEVTAEVAAFTTLTANAVNAGTLTANDVIAKGPIVDVRAFGAVGDGVHDDTAAIQAAIDSGKAVYMPKGIYLTSSPLDFTKFPQFHHYSFTMDINAVINYVGNDYAFNFLNFGKSKIYLGNVNAPNGIGVNITPTRYTNSGGYLNFYGGQITSGGDAIYIRTQDETAYANDISLYDVTLKSGDNGFHVLNASNHISDISYLNHYKLFNVSFEGTSGDNCIFLECTGDGVIEDVFLYNLRTTETSLNNKKILKTVGKVARVVGVISDPRLGSQNIRQYIDVGEGAYNWNLILPNGMIGTVKSGNPGLFVNKIDLVTTYKKKIAQGNQTLDIPINTTDSSIFLINIIGDNSLWRYAGILFISSSNIVVDITASNLSVTSSDSKITVKNTNGSYDMVCKITAYPLNNILNML